MKFDPERESERITRFISQGMDELGKEGAVIGLSGGVDSAVVASLCVRAVTPQKVHGLILPERDSDPKAMEDARDLAQILGITAEEIEEILKTPITAINELQKAMHQADAVRSLPLLLLDNKEQAVL